MGNNPPPAQGGNAPGGRTGGGEQYQSGRPFPKGPPVAAADKGFDIHIYISDDEGNPREQWEHMQPLFAVVEALAPVCSFWSCKENTPLALVFWTREPGAYWAVLRKKFLFVRGQLMVATSGRHVPPDSTKPADFDTYTPPLPSEFLEAKCVRDGRAVPKPPNAAEKEATPLTAEEESKPGVWQWGFTSDTGSELSPRQIRGPVVENLFVTQVACGEKHTLMLSDLGRVLAVGENFHGQLGLGNTVDQTLPKMIQEPLKEIRVTQIAAGNQFSACLTETGNVFVWGRLRFNDARSRQVSLFSYTKPTLLEQIRRHRVTQIAAGAVHLLMLTSAGEVLSWGCPTYGRLGRTTSEQYIEPVSLPTQLFLPKETIRVIACGHQHNVLVTNEGRVFTFGRNDQGQCGHEPKTFSADESIETPALVRDFAKIPVTQVVCGTRHTLCLAANNGVYMFGPSLMSRTMLAESHVRKVSALDAKKVQILSIATGLMHALCLGEDGSVWAWGLCHYGQLGQGNTDTSSTPLRVPIRQKAFAIAAGGNTSIAVTGLLRSLLSEEIAWAFNNPKSFPDVALAASPTSEPILTHRAIIKARCPLLGSKITQAIGPASSLLRSRPSGLTPPSTAALGAGEKTDASTRVLFSSLDLPSSKSAAVEEGAWRELVAYFYSDRLDDSVVGSSDLIVEVHGQLLLLARKLNLSRLAGMLELTTIRMGESQFVYDLSHLFPPLASEETEPLVATAPPGETPRAEYWGQQYADIVFVVGDQKIPAHKAVLCARSDYYRMMFQGGMAESSQSEIVVEEDIEPEVFKALLAYLYTDLVIKDVNLAIDLLQLANKFQLKRLMTICEKNIEKDVDASSAVYVLQMATFYSAERLRLFCLEFIQQNLDAVKDSEYWSTITPEEQDDIASRAGEVIKASGSAAAGR